MKNKYCPECNWWLPIENFKKLTTKSALNKSDDGYYWCCMSCFKEKEFIGTEKPNRKNRRRHKRAIRLISIASKYSLNEDDYISIVTEQNNLCAICKTKQENKVLCVDHDHTTGLVRGLLCGNCNIGLGNFKDNPKILDSAIAYLLKNKCSSKD